MTGLTLLLFQQRRTTTGTLKTATAIATSNIKTINGLVIASVKTVSGLTP